MKGRHRGTRVNDIYIAGIAMTVGWVLLDLPLGPGAQVHYSGAAAAN